MTMNDLLRQFGEPTYYTPTAVYLEMISQQQHDGTNAIGNPPFNTDRHGKASIE